MECLQLLPCSITVTVLSGLYVAHATPGTLICLATPTLAYLTTTNTALAVRHQSLEVSFIATQEGLESLKQSRIAKLAAINRSKPGGLNIVKSTTKSNESIAQEEKLKGTPFVEVADLRDYFAAKALASIPLSLDSREQELIANAAYRQADAMLRARDQ